jgi:hypothetical protein
MQLRSGDVVLIPGKDHRIGEGWPGIPQARRDIIGRCLQRKVKIVVKGHTTTLALLPSIVKQHSEFMGQGHWVTVSDLMENPSILASSLHADKVLLTFDLDEVAHQSGVLLISSDLSRVGVRRTQNGGTVELICNLLLASESPNNPPTGSKTINDIQLQDGDIIEIPEHPDSGVSQ